MNNLSRHFLVIAAGLLLAGPTGSGAPVDRFVRTQERIDALVKRRLNPPALPADLPNPFQLAGGAKRPDGSDAETPDGSDPAAHPARPNDPPAGELPPVGTDAEALARYIARLKITGTVLLNGRVHLIINQSTYKEGDYIFLNNKDASLYLQVVRLAPDELVLGFNQAVQTVKLKGL